MVFGKRIILVEERDHRTAVATTMAHSAAGDNSNVVERAATTINTISQRYCSTKGGDVKTTMNTARVMDDAIKSSHYRYYYIESITTTAYTHT